jgi:UDP:flavonoid glycosyltransferase YjiC (YdhE family)
MHYADEFDLSSTLATIFEATRLAGVRALVSAGWSNLGGENVPENIHLLGSSQLTVTR